MTAVGWVLKSVSVLAIRSHIFEHVNCYNGLQGIAYLPRHSGWTSLNVLHCMNWPGRLTVVSVTWLVRCCESRDVDVPRDCRSRVIPWEGRVRLVVGPGKVGMHLVETSVWRSATTWDSTSVQYSCNSRTMVALLQTHTQKETITQIGEAYTVIWKRPVECGN